MIYILAERKFFLLVDKEHRNYDNSVFDIYEEAELHLHAEKYPHGVTISNYDVPLYHGDFIIMRKEKVN